jgi:hypothetical protein
LDHKHKLDLEKIEAKKELIEIQKQKELAIENAKTLRKEKTSQIININNQQIINDNRIQQINNYIVNLPSEGVINATLENCDNILKKVLTDLLKSGALEKLYYKKLNDIPFEIITTTYANDNYPQHKNIWFNKDLNTFYCVIDEQWNPMDKEILLKILRRTFEKYMKMFLKFITHDDKTYIEYVVKKEHFEKFPLHEKDEIEDIAKEALSYNA